MAKHEYKSALGRAIGLGSAQHGVEHWLAQKITAISNLILGWWFVISIYSLIGASYREIEAWIAAPVNAVLLILLIISAFYHAVLGSQVIIEDYIHCKWLKLFKLVGQRLFFFALAVASIFAILKMAL